MKIMHIQALKVISQNRLLLELIPLITNYNHHYGFKRCFIKIVLMSILRLSINKICQLLEVIEIRLR